MEELVRQGPAVTALWRWGVVARGVAGTPVFVVNGVRLPGEAERYTIEQWRVLLNPLE